MKKQNEFGLSMTEMLGVLVVIAVVTIGAIAGYRFALDKCRTAETLNEIKIISLNLSGQMMCGQTTLSLHETGNYTRFGYALTAQITPSIPGLF